MGAPQYALSNAGLTDAGWQMPYGNVDKDGTSPERR